MITEKARLRLVKAHDRLDRAVFAYQQRNGGAWEQRYTIQEAVECAEAGHPEDLCLPHCKRLASAWRNVEREQENMDEATLEEALR